MASSAKFNLTEAKSIFQSVTFWGSVLTALAIAIPSVSSKFGLTTATAATDAQYIVQAIGVAITIYGRFTAKQVVTVTGANPPAGGTLSGTKG
jgi:hypothetical protein